MVLTHRSLSLDPWRNNAHLCWGVSLGPPRPPCTELVVTDDSPLGRGAVWNHKVAGGDLKPTAESLHHRASSFLNQPNPQGQDSVARPNEMNGGTLSPGCFIKSLSVALQPRPANNTPSKCPDQLRWSLHYTLLTVASSFLLLMRAMTHFFTCDTLVDRNDCFGQKL